MNTFNPRSRQTGVTLLEALITVIVISIGLLGLAALQGRALQENQGAFQRSLASILAYDILDCMRANREAAKAGSYDLALDAGKPTGTSVPATDLNQWRTSLETGLASGKGSVDCDAAGLCTITVQWFDKSVNDDLNGDGTANDKDKTLGITLVSTL
ncbi:MAG: type IV pilus modification protein PilV [Pseudomonadota bacterium]